MQTGGPITDCLPQASGGRGNRGGEGNTPLVPSGSAADLTNNVRIDMS